MVTFLFTGKQRILSKYKKWKQQGVTVAGGNGEGSGLNQLSYPVGIVIDENKTILIADNRNNRIDEWKYGSNNSQIIIDGNEKGNINYRLWNPLEVIIDKINNALIVYSQANEQVLRWFRENQTIQELFDLDSSRNHIAMDKSGSIYISEVQQDQVTRWKDGDTDRTIVAGGNGVGDGLNQLESPHFIFINDNYSVYVSDYGNDRMMKWEKDATEGILVAGGINNFDTMPFPEGVIVDDCKGDLQGSIVVGGNGQGAESNQLNGPTRLSFDHEGNLYVADSNNNRIQKFELVSD
ncbi:unnamed protein product [Adineta ricciae]|uniref:NHL repeat containing protein n=2 Tax=Adineta ricciae TaxID=249248 RepID=A0A815NXQ5_ADIRI|nr:unnamed protein product [Adineta ricciae]